MNIKPRSLVQISVFFKKKKISLIKSIYFHFKTQAKQILVCFQKSLGKSLVWQTFKLKFHYYFCIEVKLSARRDYFL